MIWPNAQLLYNALGPLVSYRGLALSYLSIAPSQFNPRLPDQLISALMCRLQLHATAKDKGQSKVLRQRARRPNEAIV